MCFRTLIYVIHILFSKQGFIRTLLDFYELFVASREDEFKLEFLANILNPRQATESPPEILKMNEQAI